MTDCSIGGCGKPARRRGWCHMHYTRWWRHGDPLINERLVAGVCSVDGCSEPHAAQGYCGRHYARWRDHGDPLGGRLMLGQRKHPLHQVWVSMRYRCSNPNDKNYPSYGGRGIVVCERWSGAEGFLNFVADMGERPEEPSGHTSSRSYWSVERIDNDGPYAPDNCRWASAKEQQSNTRRGKKAHPIGECDR